MEVDIQNRGETPKQGNTPMRVDLTSYLGAGNYPGHSYRLVHTRGDDYGRYWTNR